jgi:threonine dehydrogenase-like Zn-dependent dehydrogenase
MISLPLGHEPAGEIIEAGSEVPGLKVGDRVAVNPQAAAPASSAAAAGSAARSRSRREGDPARALAQPVLYTVIAPDPFVAPYSGRVPGLTPIGTVRGSYPALPS